MGALGWIAAFVLVLLVGTSTAHADDKPWARVVPGSRRDAANKLFDEANQLFSQKAHSAALEKYKAAIALWDHPMIRYNMAATLIRLERVLEAADALDAALRFGAEPFTADGYQQALDYQTLLRGQVATIEVTCTQQATQVSFDGKPWFGCPGTKAMRVLAGEHVIVGEKSGFMAQSRRVVLRGGSSTKHAIELLPVDAMVKLEYPSPRWLPWTVAATGLGVAGGGLAFWLVGKREMETFEREFTAVCPTGCDYRTMPLLADKHDRAELEGTIGGTMMVAGGVVAVGGIVWLFINRPRRVTLEATPGVNGTPARVTWSF